MFSPGPSNNLKYIKQKSTKLEGEIENSHLGKKL